MLPIRAEPAFLQSGLLIFRFQRGALLSPVRSRFRATCCASSRSTISPLKASPYSTDSHSLRFHIEKNESGMRVDKALALRYGEKTSRSHLQSLLDAGHVSLNGVPCTSKSHRLHAGDVLEVHFKEPVHARPLQAEPLSLNVLYEDAHIIVLNKPAGLVVHPGAGNYTGTLLNGLAYRYSDLAALGGARPGVVHRLDKGTSGVLLAARTREAEWKLRLQFAQRLVEKYYIAITCGNPAGKGCLYGEEASYIGRDRNHRLKMTVVEENDTGARDARTSFQVLGTDDKALLHVLKVKIETGRTHQIRVHMRHRRAPVLGDELYGLQHFNNRFKTLVKRPMLHAHSIQFAHPVSGERVCVKAALPEDMRKVIQTVIDEKLLDTIDE